MTDTNGATGAQAAPETQPPAGNAEALAADAQADPQPPETISLDEARKLRSEANSLRKRLRELEERDAAAEAAKLTETERIQRERDAMAKELADLKEAGRRQSIESAAIAAAARIGYANPADAMAFIAPEDIQTGDDGMPTNIEALVAKVAKERPYLAPPKSAGSADVTASGARAASPRNFTRKQAADPVFYAANREAILAAHREGRITDA